MKSILTIAALAGFVAMTAAAAAAQKSQVSPQQWCKDEPDSAACAMVVKLCFDDRSTDTSPCKNDVVYCALHYDADLCDAVQETRLAADGARNWQWCLATSSTLAEANTCSTTYASCAKTYYKTIAGIRWIIDVRNNTSNRQPASDAFSRCLKTQWKVGPPKTGGISTSIAGR